MSKPKLVLEGSEYVEWKPAPSPYGKYLWAEIPVAFRGTRDYVEAQIAQGRYGWKSNDLISYGCPAAVYKGRDIWLRCSNRITESGFCKPHKRRVLTT